MKRTVTAKGQVTIPKGLRDRLGIRPGEVLDLREEHGQLVATKVAAVDTVDAVYGVLTLEEPVDGVMARLRAPADAV